MDMFGGLVDPVPQQVNQEGANPSDDPAILDQLLGFGLHVCPQRRHDLLYHAPI